MLPDVRPDRRVLTRLLLMTSAALLLLLHLYEPPTSGLWAQTFFNSMHVPVFGAVALSLYFATATKADWGFPQRVATVLVIVFVLSILSEAAQIPGPRDASVQDLVSDWLGAAAVLFFARAFGTDKAISRGGRVTYALIGTAVLLFALSSLIGVSAAYIERGYQRPVLVSFDAHFGRYFRRTQHASLQLIGDPANAQKLAKITLNDGAWPGVTFHDIWPDWRSYSTLIIEFGLEGDAPLDVNVRVHDRKHRLGDQPYGDRFNRSLTLRQSRYTMRIPLEDIRDAPKGRQMNLSQIDGIVIFCSSKNVGRSFQLLEIRLE